MANAAALRLPLAAVAAAAVTFGLFLVMHLLVSSGGGERGRLEPIAGIQFGPVEIPDETTIRSRRKPPPPEPPERRPPPPKMQVPQANQLAQAMPELDIPNLDVPLSAGDGFYIGNFQQVDASAEGDVIPVVVIRPMYPREAAINGTEGWVKVEFTITESGTVKRPRVVEAEPPRIFNREALRAILKWKFKPRVVDGVAIERQATQVIEFSLDDS